MNRMKKVLVSAGVFLAALCLLSPAEVLILQTGLTNVFSAGAAYSGVKDTSVVSGGGANVNYGGRTTGFIGADNVTTLNRSLISFDLTSLAGQNVVVTSAVLKIRAVAVVTATVAVYRVSAANADWTEGDKGGTLATEGESTWNKIHYNTVNWAGSAGLSTSGTDYLAMPISTAPTDGAWEEFVFTDVSFIADWINGANGGLMLKSADREAAGTGKVTFYTSEGTASFPPILELGIESGYTVVPKPVPRGALSVSVIGNWFHIKPYLFYSERKLHVLLDVVNPPSKKEMCGRVALFASECEEVLAEATVTDIGATGGKTHIFDLSDLNPGQYEVRAEALDGDDGPVLAKVMRPFELPEKPSWEYAMSSPDEVPPPWIPLTVLTNQSAEAQLNVSCWGRTYTFGAHPLPKQILALDHTLLSGPVRFSGRVDGRSVEWNSDFPVVEKETAAKVVLSTTASDPAITLTTKVTIDFDGLMRFDCTLKPEKKVRLENLTIEIPFRREHAQLVYYYRDKLFQAPGVLPEGGVVRAFNPAIWLGTEDYGLQWFAESDQNWYVADVNRAIEIVPDGEEVILRLNLVTAPVTLESGTQQTLTSAPQLQYTFGLQATPVKPVSRDAWDLHTAIANYSFLTRHIGTEWAFDYFANRGVKTVLLFAGWTDIFGEPECVGHNQELHQTVEACHQRGMKVIIYLGSYFSDDSLQFPAHLQEFTCWRQSTPFSTYSYPVSAPLGQEQQIYLTCNGSDSWRDFILSGAERLMDEYDVDGFYLDGVGTANACYNDHHSCSYDQPDGIKVPSYPFFASRELLRRLRTIVKSRKPDGIIDFHAGGFRVSSSIGWVDNVWDGETILGPIITLADREAAFLTDYLSNEVFRGQFLGTPWGSSSEFLGYRVPVPYEQLWAITLLHDIPIRPTGSATNLQPASEIWSVMDTFGRKEATWKPYWKNADCVFVQPTNAYVSLYKHPEHGVLAVVSNLGKESAEVQVALSLEKLGLSGTSTVHDAISGKAIAVEGGRIIVDLDSVDWKLVWVTP